MGFNSASKGLKEPFVRPGIFIELMFWTSLSHGKPYPK